MTIPDLITAAAGQYGVDPRLALAVAWQESHYDPNARGAAGEIGVFQLLPATAAQLGVDPYDAAQNIAGGVRYLRTQIDAFGDLAAALAAYNWGPGNVARWGAAWAQHAPASTRAYVQAILGTPPPEPPGGGEVQTPANGVPVYTLTVFGQTVEPAALVVLLLLVTLLVARK